MGEHESLTVEQLYNYARIHNMEHAKLLFSDGDGSYYHIVNAEIKSSIHHPDQQFIVLS